MLVTAVHVRRRSSRLLRMTLSRRTRGHLSGGRDELHVACLAPHRRTCTAHLLTALPALPFLLTGALTSPRAGALSIIYYGKAGITITLLAGCHCYRSSVLRVILRGVCCCAPPIAVRGDRAACGQAAKAAAIFTGRKEEEQTCTQKEGRRA